LFLPIKEKKGKVEKIPGRAPERANFSPRPEEGVYLLQCPFMVVLEKRRRGKGSAFDRKEGGRRMGAALRGLPTTSQKKNS